MIEVENIVKRYGGNIALNDISFTVNDGEVLGFLGPNGAGKSTTMNIITGYISSTSGTVKIDGHDILKEPKKAKALIGYLPEIPPVYNEMTVRKYLEFIFDLKKVKLPKNEHIGEICKLVKIDDVSQRLIKNLSKGYKQRVGLAQALVGDPSVLILDEPTVGLDPKQILEIRNLIKRLSKKHTIILSSHILSEVQAICDRVIVINNGKIVADKPTDELSTSITGSQRLLVQIEGNESDVIFYLKTIKDIVKIKKNRSLGSVNEFILESKEGSDIRRDIFNCMVKANCPILLMKSAELTLEEAFLRLTDGSDISFSKSGGEG